MKKLMFVAVAALCGSVFADDASITSANIVGYQDKAAPTDAYTTAAPTFAKVDGTELKIKDFTPKGDDIDQDTFKVIVWSTSGNPMLIQEDAWIAENYPALAEGEFAEFDVQLCYDVDGKKWYLYYDFEDKNYDMSEYPIPQGCGFSIFSDDERGLTFSGQVDKEDFPLTSEGEGYVMTGNIAPVDMTIGDFAVEGEDIDQDTFKVIMWGTSGDPMLVEEDPWILENYPEAATAFEGFDVQLCYDVTGKKWYLYYDFEDKNYDMTNYPIVAGQGFSLYCDDEGKTLVLPSAL